MLHISGSGITPIVQHSRVLGRWTNNQYYRGHVTNIGHKIDVQFDDGDRISHDPSDVSAVLYDVNPHYGDIQVSINLFSLSLSLSFFLPSFLFYLSIYLSFFLFLSFFLSSFLSFFLSLFLSFFLFFSQLKVIWNLSVERPPFTVFFHKIIVSTTSYVF